LKKYIGSDREVDMSKNNYNFFAFVSRMRFINRWGLMRNTYTESIQEHSHEVAILAHALAVIKNTYFNGNVDENKIAVMALYHDSDEIITGDLPTPIKYYNPEIKQAYKAIEDIAKDKLLKMLPDSLKPAYQDIIKPKHGDEELWKIVKSADRITAYIKCIEEEKAGNKEFKKAGIAILKTIHEINSPEVEYFMEHFIDGYKLSLDEIE
jgi:Predicted hydrolases of HD superfamily